MARVRFVVIGIVACAVVILSHGAVASSDSSIATTRASSSHPLIIEPLNVEPLSQPISAVSPELVFAWMKTLDRKKANHYLAEAIADIASSDPVPMDAAAKLVSIAYHESHFDLNAKSKLSDPAKAIGAFQISLEWIKKENREAFLNDSYEQTRMALWLVRDSQKRCGDLAQYASGSCDRGGEEAVKREKVAYKLLFETYINVNEKPILVHKRTY